MIAFAFLYMAILIPFAFFAGGIITYIAGTNLITFFIMGYDKFAAIKRYLRIPERFLWLMCVIGGTLGCILAMLIFHHKTEKNSFHLPVIGILLVQILILYLNGDIYDDR